MRYVTHSVFVNLATANYLLAGVQRVTGRVEDDGNGQTNWGRVMHDLGWHKAHISYADGMNKTDSDFPHVARVVRECLLPFGICAGSEKQGGQSEGNMAPVQSAANHVTTMTVDGQNIDLVNYWAHENLSAGDQLILKLERLPTFHFNHNHYYKSTSSQSFDSEKTCWQLVPSVFRMSKGIAATPPQPAYSDYRLGGYWRIAQLMHRMKSCRQTTYVGDDLINMQSGGSAQLLQVLFAPVYHSRILEDQGRAPLDLCLLQVETKVDGADDKATFITADDNLIRMAITKFFTDESKKDIVLFLDVNGQLTSEETEQIVVDSQREVIVLQTTYDHQSRLIQRMRKAQSVAYPVQTRIVTNLLGEYITKLIHASGTLDTKPPCVQHSRGGRHSFAHVAGKGKKTSNPAQGEKLVDKMCAKPGEMHPVTAVRYTSCFAPIAPFVAPTESLAVSVVSDTAPSIAPDPTFAESTVPAPTAAPAPVPAPAPAPAPARRTKLTVGRQIAPNADT